MLLRRYFLFARLIQSPLRCKACGSALKEQCLDLNSFEITSRSLPISIRHMHRSRRDCETCGFRNSCKGGNESTNGTSRVFRSLKEIASCARRELVSMLYRISPKSWTLSHSRHFHATHSNIPWRIVTSQAEAVRA